MQREAICRACGATIVAPDGKIGPAIRRHYWAKHRAQVERPVRVRK